VMVEYYRIRCPKCGLKTEQVPQLPTKAPFSKDFEDAVGLGCDSAAARQVALTHSFPLVNCLVPKPHSWHGWRAAIYEQFLSDRCSCTLALVLHIIRHGAGLAL